VTKGRARHSETSKVTEHNHKLSVMQIILNLEMAGAQEVVRSLAEFLPANGCTVTVCGFEDGPMRAEIEKLGVQVAILGRPRHSVVYLPLFVKELLRIRRELAGLVKAHQVDVVQTHILQVLDFLVLTLRHGTGLRLVLWTMQDVEFLPKRQPWKKEWLRGTKRLGYRLLYRLLASQVDGFIAVSDEVRRSIVNQVGPVDGKIFTMCNAVNVKAFEHPGDKAGLCRQLGLADQARLIATVGRLTEQKGHAHLIEAARSVVAAWPDAHFLFIGDGELRDALRQQAEAAGLAHHIHFLGVRKDIPALLAAADLFVLPSLWEGLSLALLEAMAAARPIVATAVSGTTQAMIPAQTGLVVPPRDSRALAEAIMQLLSDAARAQAMGQAARQHVAMYYSAQKQARDYAALYRHLLG
jgi:glycosyltransferase involved in cell wall biosynthesis